MKVWNVVFERINEVEVKDEKIIAEVTQYVRDNEMNSEVRNFKAWAPVLKID